MRYSSKPFSSFPYSSSSLDASLPATVDDLIEDQEFPRTYLFRATPYDKVTGAEIEVRASLGIEFPILDGKHWPAILNTAINYNVQLFDGSWVNPQGRTSLGNIELLVGSGEYDHFSQYLWGGRNFEIYLGAEHFDFTEYRIVVAGVIKNVSYNDDKFIIAVGGKESLLEKRVQEEILSDGNPKPIAYGEIKNFTPPLAVPDKLIYQIHDGEIDYTDLNNISVYDGGAPLTLFQLVADISAATAPPPGFYSLQPVGAGAYIRIGAPPAKGVITVDYRGQISREFGVGDYLIHATDILRDVLTYRSDLTDDDLDLASFGYIDSHPLAKNNYSGLIIQDETLVDVINYIMRSLNGAWTFTPSGKLKIALFERSASTGTITSNDIMRLSREHTEPPPWKWKIGYWRNWTVQTDDDLVGTVTPDRRRFVSREYFYSQHVRNDIKAMYPDAPIFELDTCLQISSADPAINPYGSLIVRLRQNILAYVSPDPPAYHHPEVYKVVCVRQQFRYDVGQTVTINHPRFGLESGKDILIMELSENTASGQTTLTGWA